MSDRYKIIDDFQAKEARVLQLDRDFESFAKNTAVIDGKRYSFDINSIRSWIIIQTNESFKGKTVTFE